MIGRGIRLRMPVEVYFVDAAWAPNSAEGRPETARSSVLVAMREVLATCLAARDADQRDTYQALYGVFADAFRDIDGVIFPHAWSDEQTEDFDPSPAGLEDAMDGWVPNTDAGSEEQAEDEDQIGLAKEAS